MSHKQIRTLTQFILLSFCLLFTLPSMADVYRGFAAEFKLGKEHLVLNGTGTRVKLFVKAYDAALYLPHKSTDSSAILSNDTPIAVHLLITSDLSTTQRMVAAIQDGFELSTQGNLAPYKARIDQLSNALSKELMHTNDTIEFNYLPGKGVSVVKNGALQTVIPGADFRQAFFGIWLSENPVSAKLKYELLGKQP